MRRLAVFLSLLCLLSLPVSAAYIPESSVTENRDGRQLIIKTYQLSPEDDPSELVDEPFDLEGYHYEHLETVKEDQTFHDSKAHTETVTVTTSSDSLAAILEQLAPTMEYSKDGYSGVLTLDHTTLQTEAAGYTTKYYTITDTKQFTGLPRNDPSYVPTTTVKDGKTLSLSNISWAVTGTGLADDTLVPTSYTATATYQATGDGYAGKFKVLYPLESVQGETGSVQLSFSTNVYKYAVFFAICQEKDEYGELQNYVVDTDPTTTMRLSAYSNYSDGTTIEYETGLRILKYETGTEIPISGALFEVIGPDGDSIGTFVTNGDGRIEIPLSKVGNYTVIERQAPSHYIISEEPAQNVTVVYDEVAEVTFFNDPYGTLRIEKKSDTGMNLPGAVIKIEHIESGQTWTATTTSAGVAIFDQIPLGAYRIQEITAPAGWKLDDTVYTATVVAGETTTIPIINEELPGLRIIKYDRKNMVAMPNVTFAVYRDGKFLGNFKTDQFGEILLTNVEPGTYRAFEVDTGDEGHILDTTPQEVELHAGDGIKELLFFNDVKPGLQLVKVDSDDPSKVIPNAVFEIKSVEGTYGPQEFRTDENGEIDLSMLPPGSYVVTEKSCDGYVIDEAQRIIELKPNEDAQFVFTNHINPSLQLIKLSSDGSRLAGVTFRIAKIEDGSHYLDRTTNSTGEILISGLEPGVYSVRELSSVLDHIPDDTEHHVELFPGQTSTITLTNDKRPNLYIHKADGDTGAPIPGTVYLVKGADGHSIAEVKTDETGVAVVENLLPGVVEVIEKSVPEPYLLAEESQLVTLFPNRDRDVYFQNYKRPTIEIRRRV